MLSVRFLTRIVSCYIKKNCLYAHTIIFSDCDFDFFTRRKDDAVSPISIAAFSLLMPFVLRHSRNLRPISSRVGMIFTSHSFLCFKYSTMTLSVSTLFVTFFIYICHSLCYSGVEVI